MSIRNLVFLSFARTGSNFLLSVLKNNNNNNIKAVFEPFHPKGCLNLTDNESNKIGRIFDLEINNCKNDELVKVIHEKPVRFLRKTQELLITEEKYLMFKIFPGHLETPKLERIIEKLDSNVVILKRRPIDMFISLCKAQKIKEFTTRDTTNIDIQLDADRYISYHKNLKKWHDEYKRISLKYTNKVISVDYEDFIGYSEENIYYLLYSKLLSNNINLNSKFNLTSKVIKQDTGSIYSSKVSNWGLFFKTLLEKNQLETLNKF